MDIKKLFLLSLFLISVVSCNENSKTTIKTAEPKEEILFEIENDKVAYFVSGSFINENEFVLLESSGKSIYMYNTDGLLLSKFNLDDYFFNKNYFEIIRVNDNNIFLWDSERLQLHSFNLINFKTSLLLETDYGINDFYIDSNLIALYPVANQGLLKIFDLESSRYIFEDSSESETHKVLSALKHKGKGLIISDKSIQHPNFIYTALDNVVFNNIIINNKNEILVKKKPLDIVLFNNEIIDSNNFYTNVSKLSNYLSESELVISIFIIDKNFLIITESGKFISIDKSPLDNSNRFINYFIIDSKNHKVISKYKLNHKFDDSFYFSNEKKLFKVHRKENSDSYYISLILLN